MKIKILLTLCLNLTFCYSQGNLQFSQVINITNGANEIVPVGKVWKIDAVNISPTWSFVQGTLTAVNCTQAIGSNSQFVRTCYYSANYLSINGVNFVSPTVHTTTTGSTSCATPCPSTNSVSGNSTALTSSELVFPIWLSAGQNISVISGSGILVSIVEFNIVP
jgi:hypothetical protein